MSLLLESGLPQIQPCTEYGVPNFRIKISELRNIRSPVSFFASDLSANSYICGINIGGTKRRAPGTQFSYWIPVSRQNAERFRRQKKLCYLIILLFRSTSTTTWAGMVSQKFAVRTGHGHRTGFMTNQEVQRWLRFSKISLPETRLPIPVIDALCFVGTDIKASGLTSYNLIITSLTVSNSTCTKTPYRVQVSNCPLREVSTLALQPTQLRILLLRWVWNDKVRNSSGASARNRGFTSTRFSQLGWWDTLTIRAVAYGALGPGGAPCDPELMRKKSS